MDPTWDETSDLPQDPGRAPAQLTASPPPAAPAQSAPPAWEDTAPVAAQAESGDVPTWDETDDLSKYSTPGQQAIAGLEGLGEGVGSFVSPWIEKKLGGDPDAMRLRAEANPWTHGLTEAGGLIIPAFLTAGASVEAREALAAGEIGAEAAKGTALSAKIAKNFTAAGVLNKVGKGAASAVGLGEASGFAAKVAANSVKMGAEMMALQGGSELTKAIENDPAQTSTNALQNIGLSGVVGAGIGVPFGVVGATWDALAGPTASKVLTKIKTDWGMGDPLPKEEEIVSPALKQLLNVFGGVPKDTIEQYAAQRDLVMAAPEFHEVYGQALDHLLDMQDNLATKKESVAAAKTNFQSFLGEQKLALQKMGYDAKSADTLAQQALKEAQTRVGIGLQDGALEAAPKAFSAVQKLKQSVFDLSAKATDVLDNTPGELSIKPLYDAIGPMKEELYDAGKSHLADALQSQMDQFAERYGNNPPYARVKPLVQGLQGLGKWNFNATEVQNGLSPYFNELSGILNESLKDAVPAYRSAMEPTADATKLLRSLKRYGTPELANSSAIGLKNVVKYTNEMPLLKNLEAKTGIQFTDQLERYASPTIKDSMIKALPEYKQSLRTAEALQQLKDPEVRAALEKAPYLSQSYKELNQSQTALDQALERKSQMGGLSPNTLEEKMKSVMGGKGGKGLNARRVLENIPGMNDMSIPEVLDLIRIREAFEKGAMNGSRNVNLMAKLGGGLGSVIGGIAGLPVGAPGAWAITGGAAGTGLGAFLGGVLDKEGPAIVKAQLDRYLDINGDLPRIFGSSPSNIKAALLHFLGSDKPIDAKAFKSTVNYIDAQKKGDSLLRRSVESIFQGGKTIPNHVWSNQDKIKELDEKAKKIKGNEQGLLDTGGGVGHYMPTHGQALSQTVARAVGYINENRPSSQKLAPLDDEMEPSHDQMFAYNRGLEIAQQPLTVIKRIKDGTLLPEDVQHLNAMYPEYYQHMKQVVMDTMGAHLNKDGKVPYSLRQSLSLFMGETLDSSLAPQNIQAAQAVFQAQRQAPPQAQTGQSKGSTKKLGDVAERYKTADQSAQARRSTPT